VECHAWHQAWHFFTPAWCRLTVVVTPYPFEYYQLFVAGNKLKYQVSVTRQWHYGWLLLILLAAAWLRLHNLADIPPGLTHDEADHGATAWAIVHGERDIYFTVGYGREPFYDYATAILMTFLGPTYFAGRLAAVFFSLILLAGTFAWVRRAFDGQTALLAIAGLAVAFWPIMSARQALRSITLPALFVLAVYFFWSGLQRSEIGDWRLGIRERRRIPGLQSLTSFLVAGLLLGITFYTYIPARILWTIFPALLAYLLLVDRPLLRRVWPGTILMLLAAAVVALPLFYYLYTHPAAEGRVRELSTPLTAAVAGEWRPLLTNAAASLRLFTLEGDPTWRYNIPGRPLLSPVLGPLFYGGVAIAVWQSLRASAGRSMRRRQQGMACFLALAWLVAGFSPVLVTGPDLSMTQAIGMQPVMYLFPALALTALARLEIGDYAHRLRPFAFLAPLLIFSVTAAISARDYFMVWANAPEVRVQYETALVTVIEYLNERGHGVAAISTTTPNRFHTPALAQMTLRHTAVTLGYFDGGSSLLIPQQDMSLIIFSGFAPLNPALASYFETAERVDTLSLRPTDHDRPLTIYRVDGPALLAQLQTRFDKDTPTTAIYIGDAVEFLGYDLQTPVIAPGEPVQLATLWRIKRPVDNAVLFTHVLAPDGALLAQADRLDVPGDVWRPGDVFIQLHQFTLPTDTAEGHYPLTVGLYTCLDEPTLCRHNQRLPVIVNGASTGDTLKLATPLIVTE